jgi:hypothetical protein
MDWLTRLARWALRIGVALLAVAIATALVEFLPPLRTLDAAITRARGLYLGIAAGLCGLGFLAFMAGVIYGAVAGMPSRETGQPMEQADSRRGSFRIEVSFRELKEAWRRGRWRTDRAWAFVVYMAGAAALMVTGIFSVVFVLGASGLRLIIAAVYLYVVAMIAWGLARA